MTSRLAVIAVLLLSWTPVWGQQSPPPFGDTIVVTATGDTGSGNQIGAATTVIDAAQLQASGAANLAELLRRVPGAELLRSGLEGGVSTLFVRGTSSTQTLVLFDGVRLNSPFFGGYDWSLPLTTGIGRVEIVRGPYSALYGSDALGGVVQIFPARASDSRVRLFAEGGAEGWRRSELEALVRAGAWSVTVAGGARDGSGSLANDDFRSRAGLVDASYEIAPGTRASVLFHRLTLFTGIPFSGARVTPHRSTSEDETVAAIPIHVALHQGSELELALSRVERTVGFRDPDDPQG
ncbi:MAG: TonB-dependent receptor, partial [Acidobacteriota bacterium]